MQRIVGDKLKLKRRDLKSPKDAYFCACTGFILYIE